jgi:pantoate--beta-alanine ligase
MKILRTVDEATEFINSQEKPIGFVPTMGALHEGHLALLKQAKQENAVAGVSIFVNPLQFNNPSDFANYPIDTSNDVAMLEEAGTDFLFLPNKEELLQSHQVENYGLGEVDSVMEGKFRPGHFQGVANIVDLLFSVIKPQNAYFGEKDFQQLAVIRKLVAIKNIPVNIIGCATIREPNGLALSSRNRRLDSETKEQAAEISRFICSLNGKYPSQISTETIRADVYALLGKFNFKPDYFEICDHYTLHLQEKFDRSKFLNACIAYYAGEVRLIDNCPYPPSDK